MSARRTAPYPGGTAGRPRREYKGPLAARPGLLEYLRGRGKLLLTAVGMPTLAGLVGIVTNFEFLSSRAKAYMNERAYNTMLVHPYPDLLTEEELKRPEWTTGKLELARLRIEGYLGSLKNEKTWIKLCVGNAEGVSKGGIERYVNTRTQITERETDRLNKIHIQDRMNAIESSQTEEAAFLRIKDPFEKLLLRSSKQLLYRYKDKEVDQLDKTQLYLLRNSIYGQHGFKFSTAKLIKYANRRDWPMDSNQPADEILTAVERCNAFFLEELHPTRELGAMGRGVLIAQGVPPATPKSFTASICACFAQPKAAIECKRSSGRPYRTEYRDFVDLVLEFDTGEVNEAEWTFIDPAQVASEDMKTFADHESRFYAAATAFTASLQATLAEQKLELRKKGEGDLGAYWGVKITLDPKTRDQLASDAILSRKAATAICEATRDALEATGAFIPGLTKQAPAPLLPLKED